MNAIRSSLQKNVFQAEEERLSALCSLVKIDGKKKKRPTYLCLALSVEHPISVHLYFVKNEREDRYKKKATFLLRDVRCIDGIHPRKQMEEFNMTIGYRQYKFAASSAEEKETFIRQLQKLCSKYLPVMPDITNVPLAVDEPQTVYIPIADPVADDSNDNISGYQPISAKEEGDFRRLLARTELTIDQADKFAKVLSEQLQNLDGANIQSMMGSEQAVNQLLELLDGALGGIDEMEKEIDQCDQILSVVRDSVELIEEKDSLSVVERRNKEKLEREVKEFVANLDILNSRHLAVLSEANISDPTSIARVVEAAHAVSRFIHGSIPKPLLQMRAYAEQASKLQVLDLFVDRLMSHLSALFSNLSQMSDGQDWHNLSIPKQTQRFRALSPLSDLMSWLKSTRPLVYNAAIERYVDCTRALYKRNFERFFDAIINEVQKTLSVPDKRTSLGSTNTSRVSMESASSELPALIETVLGELGPVIDAEQKFCTRFFHMNSEFLSAAETMSNGSGDSGSMLSRSAERSINENIRTLMSQLFDLNPYLERFAKACCAKQQSNVLLLFVIMSKKVLSPQESGSYFAVTFGGLVVLIKRQFDLFMSNHAGMLSDPKIPKRIRLGILPIIDKFASVIRESEAFFEGAERRTDLEKWYVQLYHALCVGIEKAAQSPNSKSPPSVVRFENYHQLYMTLSELKIAALDAQRKEAKRLKEENIDVYVKEHMGRPLEKIHIFFELVQRAVDQGVRPEEISYQQQFGKPELKKVISMYPGREVRKGLEALYKKLEKHLVDNSSLLQVVWRSMQEQFIKQLQSYQQTIAECYPSSKVELEVSINDVLSYFSDIAQQH